MTKNANMSCILKYLAVACTRSNSDVGALVKALYHKYTEGKDESFADNGMQVLYQLFANELDDLRKQKENQSKVNSENARSKKSASKSKLSKQKKGTVVADVANDSADDDSGEGCDGDDTASSDDDDAVVADADDPTHLEGTIKPPDTVNEISDRSEVMNAEPIVSEMSDRFENEQSLFTAIEMRGEDLAATFVSLRDVYNKTGENEDQAFERWKQLSADERSQALAYARSIAGNTGYRHFLYVFLRDKEWLNPKGNIH